jgi:DNA-binding MarR family transcriptional regulator
MRTRPHDADLTGRIAEGFTRVSWQLRRRSAHRLAPLGLTDAQARLLRTIAVAERPLRMCDIAAGLGIAPRSATATVEALEAAGLVARRADADDRRSVLVVLTPSAPPLLSQLHEARCAAALEVFAPLDRVERSTLLDLLERLETRRPETSR